MFSGSLSGQASALPVAAGAMQIGRDRPLGRQLFQTSNGRGHSLAACHDLGNTACRGYVVRQYSPGQRLFHTSDGQWPHPEEPPALFRKRHPD